MEKVQLIKDHVLGNEGDVVSVHKDRASYLVRCGVAKELKTVYETKDLKVKKETKKVKPKTVKRKAKKKDDTKG